MTSEPWYGDFFDRLKEEQAMMKANKVGYVPPPDVFRRHAVLYRHFDYDDKLLYVGMSYRPVLRIAQHSSHKDWFCEVATTTYDRGFNTLEELRAAEAVAIQVERPKYNLKLTRE